jgi:hypothetical protein
MFAATLDAPVATSSMVSGGGTGLLIAERPKSALSITEHADDDDDDDDDGPIDLTMGKIGGGEGGSTGVLDLTMGRLGLGGGGGGGGGIHTGGGSFGLLDLGLSRGDSPKSEKVLPLPGQASSPGDDDGAKEAGIVLIVCMCAFDSQILTSHESTASESRQDLWFRVIC